jgi:hypothetical protein
MLFTCTAYVDCLNFCMQNAGALHNGPMGVRCRSASRRATLQFDGCADSGDVQDGESVTGQTAELSSCGARPTPRSGETEAADAAWKLGGTRRWDGRGGERNSGACSRPCLRQSYALLVNELI